MYTYIRDQVLSTNPLHRNQHAYRDGRSIETALHQLVIRFEKAISARELAMGVFTGIEEHSKHIVEIYNMRGSRWRTTSTVVRWIKTILQIVILQRPSTRLDWWYIQ